MIISFNYVCLFDIYKNAEIFFNIDLIMSTTSTVKTVTNSHIAFNAETKNLRNTTNTFKYTFTSYDEIYPFLNKVKKENGIACEYYDDATTIHPFIDLDISKQPSIIDLRRACNCIAELYNILEESINTSGKTYICGRIQADIPQRLNNILQYMFADIVPTYDKDAFMNLYKNPCNKYISLHIVFPFVACKLSAFREFMQKYLANKQIPFIDVSVYGNGRIFRCGNTCKYDANGNKIPNSKLFSPSNVKQADIYEYYSLVTCFIKTPEFNCAIDDKYLVKQPQQKIIKQIVTNEAPKIEVTDDIIETIKKAIPNNTLLDEYMNRFKLASCLAQFTDETTWDTLKDIINEGRHNKITTTYNYNWRKVNYPIYMAYKLLGLPTNKLPWSQIVLDSIEDFVDAIQNGLLYKMVDNKYQTWLSNCEKASIELDEFDVRRFINKTIADIADPCIKYQSAERNFYIYGKKQFDRRTIAYTTFKNYTCTDRGVHGKLIFAFGDKKIVTTVPEAITSEGPIYHWTKNKASKDEIYTLSLFREPRDTGKRDTAQRWLELMRKCVVEEGEDIDVKRAELSKKQWDMLIKSFAWHIQSDFNYVEKLLFLYDTTNGGTGKSMFLEGLSFLYGDMAKILPQNIAKETDRTALGALFRYSPELNDGLGKCESNAYHMTLKETAARIIRIRIMHEGNKSVINQGLTAIASNYPNPNDLMNEPGMPRRLLHVRFHRESEDVYSELANLMQDPEILGGELYYVLKEMDIGDYNPNKLTEDDLPNEEIAESTLLPYKLFRYMSFDSLYLLVDDANITKASHIIHKGHKHNKAYDYVMLFDYMYKLYKDYCLIEKITMKDALNKEDLFKQFRNTLLSNLCYSEILDRDIRGIKPGDSNTRTSFKMNAYVIYFNAQQLKNMLGITDADIIEEYNKADDDKKDDNMADAH